MIHFTQYILCSVYLHTFTVCIIIVIDTFSQLYINQLYNTMSLILQSNGRLCKSFKLCDGSQDALLQMVSTSMYIICVCMFVMCIAMYLYYIHSNGLKF